MAISLVVEFELSNKTVFSYYCYITINICKTINTLNTNTMYIMLLDNLKIL